MRSPPSHQYMMDMYVFFVETACNARSEPSHSEKASHPVGPKASHTVGPKASHTMGPSYQLGRLFVYRSRMGSYTKQGHCLGAPPDGFPLELRDYWPMIVQNMGQTLFSQLEARAPHLSGEVRGSNEQANSEFNPCVSTTLV